VACGLEICKCIQEELSMIFNILGVLIAFWEAEMEFRTAGQESHSTIAERAAMISGPEIGSDLLPIFD